MSFKKILRKIAVVITLIITVGAWWVPHSIKYVPNSDEFTWFYTVVGWFAVLVMITSTITVLWCIFTADDNN